MAAISLSPLSMVFAPTVPASRSRTRRRCFVLLAICLAAAVTGIAPAARAQNEVLYGALILASTSDHPAPVPEGLRGQADNLKTVFGYNEFRLLGQERKGVPTGTEDWFVPGRQFTLRVDTKRPVPGGYALGLTLLRDRRVLVGADVKLSRDQPLFIRGPFVGQGQILILMMVL